jgi:hypothetical protein
MIETTRVARARALEWPLNIFLPNQVFRAHEVLGPYLVQKL